MTDYPPDSRFRYRPRFADNLKVGDVIASSREGAEQVEIIKEPVHRRNLISRTRHVIHTVRLVGTDEELELIFSPSETVNTRRFFYSPTHPEMEAED